MDGDQVADREIALFERYLSRECSADEVAQVEQLTRSDVRRARLLRELTALKSATRSLDDRWNVDVLWHGVRSGLDAPAAAPRAGPAPMRSHATASPNGSAHRSRYGWAWPVGRAAALMAIAAGATLTWSEIVARSRSETVASAVRAYSTQPGQQAVVQLLDGTKVTLAASGTLVVPTDFVRGSRSVELDGEAYFEVAPDPSSPFRVRAGNVVTRVLGTEFGVRAYSTEQRIQVVVASGRVSVSPRATALANPAPETELGPGDLARVSRDGTIRVERDVDVPRYLSWRDGWLSFSDAPVSEILSELERWMGVRFTLGNPSLASRVLTTRIRPGSLQSTLAVLEAGLNVRAVQSDSGIRLEGR